MSQVIMDNRAALNCCEKKQKYAVRLRLRKRGKQSQKAQEIQNGIVSSTLKQENFKMSKSIQKLANLREENLTINLKNCLESITNYHNTQIKYQNQIVSTIVKKMKDNLRVFNIENFLLVTDNQKSKSKLGESEQFTSISSEKRIALERSSRNQGSINNQASQIYEEEQEDIKIENKEIKQNRGQLLKPKQYFLSSYSNSYKISERSSQYDDEKKEDGQQNYEQMIEMNTELRGQNSQMQQYIHKLKQQLMEKQKIISTLNKRISIVEEENKKFQEAIDIKSSEYKILEQQILGYEQKIQQLEQQILSLNSSAINHTQRTHHSRTHSNIQDYSSKSLGKSVSIQLDFDEGERQEDSKESKEMGIKNLEKIYQKTEQTLRKYKKVQKQKAQIEEERQELRIKIEQILNTIYEICDQQKQVKDVAQLQLKQVINLVGEVLDRKLSIIQLEHNERENKLQSMIAEELDQTLIIIASLCSNEVDENIINEQSTILDKIQYLRHNIQYIYLNLTNKLNTSNYFNTLFNLYGKIDQIIEKSHLFAQQLDHNNHILSQISVKLQNQQPIPVSQELQAGQNKNNKLIAYLSELEQLLAANQQYLVEDNIGYANFYKLFCLQNGTNVQKVQNYLTQLEQIMKQIYKGQENGKDEDHEKCLYERIELKTKIKELEKKNFEFTTEMQKLIAYMSGVETEQDLKHLIDRMLELNSQLRRSNMQWHKNDILLQQNTFRKIKQQGMKLQRKYFPSNPQFVEAIIHQLGEIRKISSEQSFLRIADTIFRAIKNRDEKFSQQMGRRKQVLKQRTAVISQICKKGIKDSSIQEHSFTKKQ